MRPSATFASSRPVGPGRAVPLVWPDDPDAGPRHDVGDPAFARNQLRSMQRAMEEAT